MTNAMNTMPMPGSRAFEEPRVSSRCDLSKWKELRLLDQSPMASVYAVRHTHASRFQRRSNWPSVLQPNPGQEGATTFYHAEKWDSPPSV